MLAMFVAYLVGTIDITALRCQMCGLFRRLGGLAEGHDNVRRMNGASRGRGRGLMLPPQRREGPGGRRGDNFRSPPPPGHDRRGPAGGWGSDRGFNTYARGGRGRLIMDPPHLSQHEEDQFDTMDKMLTDVRLWGIRVRQVGTELLQVVWALGPCM